MLILTGAKSKNMLLIFIDNFYPALQYPSFTDKIDTKHMGPRQTESGISIVVTLCNLFPDSWVWFTVQYKNGYKV